MIDGVNTRNEEYIRTKMCIVWTSEAVNGYKQLEDHSMIKFSRTSFAEGCKIQF